MKYNIACCDDDKEQLSRLREYFETLSFQLEVDMDVEYFLSGNILLQKYKTEKEPYDILILDVEMPDLSGLELGEQIRELAGRDVLILYLTSYPKYMHQSFGVQAFQYMIKPVDYEMWKREMLRAFQYLKTDEKAIVFMNDDKEEIVFRLNNIIYIEKEKGQRMMKVVSESETEFVKGNLQEYEERLYTNGFIRISRSCVVNMNHIRKFREDQIITDHAEVLSMSRRKVTEIKERFTKYIVTGVV